MEICTEVFAVTMYLLSKSPSWPDNRDSQSQLESDKWLNRRGKMLISLTNPLFIQLMLQHQFINHAGQRTILDIPKWATEKWNTWQLQYLTINNLFNTNGFMVLNSQAMNNYVDRSLTKFMGGLLVIILLVVATIAGYFSYVGSIKPGCVLYKWRKHSTRSNCQCLQGVIANPSMYIHLRCLNIIIEDESTLQP